jgi:hypothetical protein
MSAWSQQGLRERLAEPLLLARGGQAVSIHAYEDPRSRGSDAPPPSESETMHRRSAGSPHCAPCHGAGTVLDLEPEEGIGRGVGRGRLRGRGVSVRQRERGEKQSEDT